MAHAKYSYVFWGLFSLFVLALWVGLYVGCVIPIENSEKFKITQCTTVDSRYAGNENCPCSSSSDQRCGKSYSCLQIFVNFTVQKEAKPQARQGQLYFSENILQSNCSYKPFCKYSNTQMAVELESYKQIRGHKGTVFSCHYNKEDESQVIEVNYNGRRLAILLPFAVVLLVLISASTFLLYRRGCGCNRKRRPSRLSFVTAVDEF